MNETAYRFANFSSTDDLQYFECALDCFVDRKVNTALNYVTFKIFMDASKSVPSLKI